MGTSIRHTRAAQRLGLKPDRALRDFVRAPSRPSRAIIRLQQPSTDLAAGPQGAGHGHCRIDGPTEPGRTLCARPDCHALNL